MSEKVFVLGTREVQMLRQQAAVNRCSRSAAGLVGLAGVGVLVLLGHGFSRGQEKPNLLPEPRPVPPAAAAPLAGEAPLTLGDLTQIALDTNPILRQADLDVEIARGRARQTGLYPNPTVAAEGQEMGDPNGPGGFVTAPEVGQEIVTAGKLRLSRAVAEREVDQFTLALLRQRFALLTGVRLAYFETLTLQRRVEVLDELVRLAAQTVENTEKLTKAGQTAQLDVVQVRVELHRYRAELDATRRDLTAARRRLAAAVGVPDLPCSSLADSLESPFPDYDACAVRRLLLDEHPDIRSARVGVARAELALKRAKVEPIPNVTVSAGYMRDNVTRADEWMFRVGMPVPVFNRNQGNIQAAQAEIGRAIQEIGRVENDLSSRLATAFGHYSAARDRAGHYRRSILPDARRGYQLAEKAFQGGQFDYLRVLQAQRALIEANLEYVRSLGDAWRGASEIAGLLLEEDWPVPGFCKSPAFAPVDPAAILTPPGSLKASGPSPENVWSEVKPGSNGFVVAPKQGIE